MNTKNKNIINDISIYVLGKIGYELIIYFSNAFEPKFNRPLDDDLREDYAHCLYAQDFLDGFLVHMMNLLL